MLSNKQLLKVGNFNLQYHHLIIIGILAISFSVSFMIRSQAADYGFELNEFDPFFNLRATQFIVDNGFAEYLEWHDDKSWHTIGGRDVSNTSQVMLHLTAATLYQIFGGGLSLYEFTILFPVIFGSFTCIVIFAMVRVIGGTTAGLFAALFFSVSVPIILRGTIGWFKSEPLGLFYGIFALYFFLSGIKSENKKIAAIKLIGGGIFLGFGLSAWGGIQFFTMPLGLFFIALPFLRKDSNFIIWAIPLFSSAFLLTSLLFERTGLDYITSLGGMIILGPTFIMVIIILIQKFSSENQKIRNGLFFLIASLILTTIIITYNPVNDEGEHLVPLPSFRYLNAVNPFLTTTDPLVDSVSEHASLTIQTSFRFSSILMIFAGIGIWLSLRYNEKKNNLIFLENDMKIFALIIGDVSEKIRIPSVEIRGVLEVSSNESDGVEIIKKILLDVIKNAKGSQVKITYLGAPKYRISVIGEDFKSVEKILKPVLSKIQESIEKKKGLFKFSREESIKTRVG